ncbi:hypothetical protein GOEFS_105_00060 [Gordonia effusa NBRC 100432]|uniref:Secreted protein n=1 Tax=Gordonia effusa NBRC 100432 TaxID=1077974 RepID=H0R4J4_9ACTN|nr:hypothetical protein [Gordonia effusa]GAB19995.1 hypothetical protein GOEFS_105_00060 [Gordonia effusa NBRC 100432]
MIKRATATLFASTAIAAGLLTAVPVTADASTPRIGSKCSGAEANNYRHTKAGTPTVCAHLGSGAYKWVRVAKADPVRRSAGQPCTGKYSVAVTRKGKALVCASGRWRTSP